MHPLPPRPTSSAARHGSRAEPHRTPAVWPSGRRPRPLGPRSGTAPAPSAHHHEHGAVALPRRRPVGPRRPQVVTRLERAAARRQPTSGSGTGGQADLPPDTLLPREGQPQAHRERCAPDLGHDTARHHPAQATLASEPVEDLRAAQHRTRLDPRLRARPTVPLAWARATQGTSPQGCSGNTGPTAPRTTTGRRRPSAPARWSHAPPARRYIPQLRGRAGAGASEHRLRHSPRANPPSTAAPRQRSGENRRSPAVQLAPRRSRRVGPEALTTDHDLPTNTVNRGRPTEPASVNAHR